jgi:superfamily II DNA or RNA helicase
MNQNILPVDNNGTRTPASDPGSPGTAVSNNYNQAFVMPIVRSNTKPAKKAKYFNMYGRPIGNNGIPIQSSTHTFNYPTAVPFDLDDPIGEIGSRIHVPNSNQEERTKSLPFDASDYSVLSGINNYTHMMEENAKLPQIHYYKGMKSAINRGNSKNNYVHALYEGTSDENIVQMIDELKQRDIVSKTVVDTSSNKFNETPSNSARKFIERRFSGINKSSENYSDKLEGKTYLDYILRASKGKEGDDLQAIQADACSRFVARCRDQPGALILHSVGSGKTRTGICLAMGFPRKHRIIIITPPGLEVAWKQEFQKLCMDVENSPSTCEGTTEKARKLMKNDDSNDRILYINFNTLEHYLRLNDPRINDFNESIVVVDEAHYFLNFYYDNVLGKKLSEVLNTTHRLYLMTGTPFQKNWGDFGRLINLAARTWPPVLPVSEEQIRNKYPIIESAGTRMISYGFAISNQIVKISEAFLGIAQYVGLPQKILQGLSWVLKTPPAWLLSLSPLANEAVKKRDVVTSPVSSTAGVLKIISSGYEALFGGLAKSIPINVDALLNDTSSYMTFYNYTVTDRMLEYAMTLIEPPTDSKYWDNVILQFYKFNNYQIYGNSYVNTSHVVKTLAERCIGTVCKTNYNRRLNALINPRRDLEIKLFQIGCATLDIKLPDSHYMPEIKELIGAKGDVSIYNRFKQLKIALNDVLTKLKALDDAENRKTGEQPPFMYRDVIKNTYTMLNIILLGGKEPKRIDKPTLLTDLLSFPRKNVIARYIPFTEWQQNIYYGNAISPEFTYQHELYLVGRLTDDDLQRYDGGNAEFQGEMITLKFMEHMRICGNLSPDKLYIKTREVPSETQDNDIYKRCFEAIWREPNEMDIIMSKDGYTHFNRQINKILKHNSDITTSSSGEYDLKGFLNMSKGTRAPNGAMGCLKFEYALKLILESRATHNYIPVVFSNFIKNGFESFSAYLTSFGLKHIVLHADDSPAVSQKKIEAANNISYPKISTTTDISKLSIDDLRALDTPVCIILHPTLKEGLSFTNNEIMILLEPVMGAGNQDQVYGRVLRRFGEPQMPRKTKDIYVLISNDDSTLRKDDYTQIPLPVFLQKIIPTIPSEFRLPAFLRLHKTNIRMSDANKQLCMNYEKKWKADAVTVPEQIINIDTNNTETASYNDDQVNLRLPGIDVNQTAVPYNQGQSFKQINSSYSFPISLNISVWSKIMAGMFKAPIVQAMRALKNPLGRINPGQAVQAQIMHDITVTADTLTILYNERQETEMNRMFDIMNRLSDNTSLCADKTKGIYKKLQCERFRSVNDVGTCVYAPSFRKMALPASGDSTGKQYTLKELMEITENRPAFPKPKPQPQYSPWGISTTVNTSGLGGWSIPSGNTTRNVWHQHPNGLYYTYPPATPMNAPSNIRSQASLTPDPSQSNAFFANSSLSHHAKLENEMRGLVGGNRTKKSQKKRNRTYKQANKKKNMRRKTRYNKHRITRRS